MCLTCDMAPLFADVPNPYGSFDSGDPSTTNLYLGNLSPKVPGGPKVIVHFYFEISPDILSQNIGAYTIWNLVDMFICLLF